MARDAAVAPAIALHDAAVHLGGRTIWSDLSIEIGAGEFVAILGPNGAGKSTLLKVVLGLLTLTSGTVRVLGLPPGQANERVGYVPQRRNFDPSLRVRGVDIVELGLDGARWWFPVPGATLVSKRARAELARIHAAVDLVGGTHYAHRPIGAVSGGEQQRLLIAQALVRQPAVLILDEPLESLDLPNQTAVSALIQQIAHDHGVTVLMVVHDVNPILPYVDRVLYVAGGRALIGSPNAVINSDTLSNLYSSPVEVLRARDGRLVVVGQPAAAGAA